MKRTEHTFQFTAQQIAEACMARIDYHGERLEYWEKEYDTAVETVEATIGAKVVRQPVTDGYKVDVVVDYGDKAAYSRMQQAFSKIDLHRTALETFKTELNVYSSQNGRSYELDASDVQYFNLGGAPQID